MFKGDHRLCPDVGQGHRLGFVIVWAVGHALLLGEVNGQAFWSAGTSAVPCIWVGLEIMLPPCAGLLCRLSVGLQEMLCS